MTKIKNTTAYPIKQYPVVTDFFIGSDSENEGQTVNFSIQAVVNMAAGLTDYIYSKSSLPLTSPEGDGYFLSNGITDFAAITTLSVSKITLSGQNMTAYLNFLKLNTPEFTLKIISKTNLNIFAYFSINTITEHPDYFVFQVVLADGNNYLGELEDKDYYSFIYEKIPGTGPDLITQFITDGDTTHAPSSDAVFHALEAIDLNVLHTIGNESFTGIKSATNTGFSQINGFDLTNNGSSTSSSLKITNTSTGLGAYLINSGAGATLRIDNNAAGNGIRGTNSGITGGFLFFLSNLSIGTGVVMLNSGTGNGFESTNQSTGIGFKSVNSGSGIGIFSESQSPSGNSIVSNILTTGTGFAYVGQNNGANTFTVDKLGNITANSFIKTGGLATQFLKADGSIDSATYAIDTNVLHTFGDESKNGRLSVAATSASTAFTGQNTTGVGITGVSSSNYGIVGTGATGGGVFGNSTSGTGVTAGSISGIGLRVNNTTGNTSNLAQFEVNSAILSKIDSLGNITANSFIKTGGLATQFLKADGSVDSSTYLTSTSGAAILHAPTHVSGGSDPIAGQSLAVTVTPTPINYTPINATLQGHLLGVDQKLGLLTQTTAGITNRIYFTGDDTTIAAGTFFTSNGAGKGTATAGVPQQTLSNGDNIKQYFAKDIISIAALAVTLGPPGVYSGQLTVSATPTPAGTQQRYTIEVYKTNNGGTPIASGITGAPVGSLGVTVVAILDSGLVNTVAGSITNINLSGNLASQLTLNVGERLRYHVSSAKVGTGGGNVTMNVFYGTNYNSFYDVPVTFNTDTVLNKSLVVGITASDALNTLNAGKQNVLTNPVTGIGTVNMLAKFTSAGVIGDSKIFDDGTKIGIGTTALGNARATIDGIAGGDNLLLRKSSGASLAIEGATGTINPILLIASNSTNPDFLLYAGGVERLRVLNNGNVGIGTTTPLVKFVNSGGAFSNGANLGVGDTGSQAMLSQNGAWGLYQGVSNAGYVWSQVSRNDGNTATYPYILQPNGGNVGIGTVAPVNYGGYISLTIGDNAVNKSGLLKFRSTYNSGDGAEITQIPTGDVYIGTNSTSANLVLLPNGNVGIGTTTPRARLEAFVGLPISIPTPSNTTNGILLTDGGLIGVRLGVANLTASGGGYPAYIQAYDLSGAGNQNILLNPLGGNVGIGTVTPGDKLHVIGNARIQGTDARVLILNASGVGGIIGAASGVNSFTDDTVSGDTIIQATQRLFLVSGGASSGDKNVVLSNGQLGVGIATPVGKFHVKTDINNNLAFINDGGGVIINCFNDGGSLNRKILFQASDYTFSTSGTPRLIIDANGVLFSVPTYNNTTGAAANVAIDASGILYRSTSSRRYKKNIKNYNKGLKEVMSLRPVMYESINKTEKGVKYAGLIAEELDELGLTEFVQYNQEKEPDAISYQNMIALLTKAIQEQQVQIEELKASLK